MAGFQGRLAGALRLDARTFEDVEHDASATSQAALVVLLSSAAGLISVSRGGFAVWMIAGTFVLGLIVSLISWAIGAAVVWLLGTRLFPESQTEADYGQLLRTVGFAQAPGLFYVLLAVPQLAFVVDLGVKIWSIVAMVIAVRQALDYTGTVRAVIVCLVAALVMIGLTYPIDIWSRYMLAGTP